MNYNQTNFNCSFDESCNSTLGYINNDISRYSFIAISGLSLLSNLFLIINNLLTKSKKGRKASLRKIFLIFPVTDLLTSIYWLLSSVRFYKLEFIQNDYKVCTFNSLFYIIVTTFQFSLINCLIIHFRKINTNPIQVIFNPNKNFVLYLLICFILGALVAFFSEFFNIIGRSPLNTCFVNTKLSDISRYIIIIPFLCIVLAIIQLIHDLFFISMFNSDKGIRKLHKKNACYVFIFCLLHIPLIVVMVFSLIIKENYYYIDNNGQNDRYYTYYRYFIIFTTYLTCLIPLIMSILRQIQGLSRIECINEYIKQKKRAKYINAKTLNSSRKIRIDSKDDPSLASDPFEWLENQVIHYYMRDILLGVAVSLKKSQQGNSRTHSIKSDFSEELTPQDYQKIAKYEINFDNYKDYNIDDITIDNSDYLNVKVIDYAPKCFSYLRQLENIDIKKMIESFLPKNNTQGMKQSPGKSGSFFISTDDNKYMIKTLKADELELLKHAFLKKYVDYIKDHPNSLLCRLYGMYNIILGQGDEILIIVMRNVIGDFKDNTIVKFDLKGSTYKRKANFNMNVMKDLDFNEFERSIMLSISSKNKLKERTKSDSEFLRDSGLMDYSLFLVKLTLNKNEAQDTFGKQIKEKLEDDFNQIIIDDDNDNNINSLNIRKTYKGEGKIHDVKHYRQYLFPSLTQGTAYIISIIDYFQIFNFFKYVESTIKTNFILKKKQKKISCVEPVAYSKRFIEYINSLTDVKQYLSNEIKELPKEEERQELQSNEDSEDEENNIFKKYNKENILSLQDKHKDGILLPLDIRKERLSYTQYSNKSVIE